MILKTIPNNAVGMVWEYWCCEFCQILGIKCIVGPGKEEIVEWEMSGCKAKVTRDRVNVGHIRACSNPAVKNSGLGPGRANPKDILSKLGPG